MKSCSTCGRPPGSSCAECLSGNPPAARVAELATTPSQCIRGCVVYGRHLTTCLRGWLPCELNDQARDQLFDADQSDTSIRARVWIGRFGGLEEWRDCRGCAPRDATHGHLCDHCHGRLADWLAVLPWLYGWLSENVTPSTGSAARQDWQRPSSKDGLPAPVRIKVMDLRTLLTDRLVELEDCARDEFDRPARGRFTVNAAVQFLRVWLPRIEAEDHLVNHMFELLEDLVRKARSTVPWEDRPRRIAGIVCPHCSRTALEVKPGMEDVTCRHCHATIPKQRYEIWTRILASEAAGPAA